MLPHVDPQQRNKAYQEEGKKLLFQTDHPLVSYVIENLHKNDYSYKNI